MDFFGLVYLTVFSIWALGVVNADLATGKIPNSRAALGAGLLLGALGLLLLNSCLGSIGVAAGYLNWNFYLLWGGHFGLTVLAGAVLWYSEIWPAGDAKFFMLTALWLPLINPLIKNFPDRLFLTLLINIFVAASLVSIGSLLAAGPARARPGGLFKEIISGLGDRLRGLARGNKNNRREAAAYAANMTFLFLLPQAARAESLRFFPEPLSRPDLLYFFLFFLWDKIGPVFRSKRWLYVSTACYILYFIAGYFYFRGRLAGLLLSALANASKFGLLLFFGRFVLESLLERKDLLHLRAAELEPGMLLGSKTARTFRQNPVFCGAFEDCFKDGLTEEQVLLIKNWMEKLPVPDAKIEVVRGRPFALWIFAGAVMSLVFDRNLADMLR
ncbi:MAG: hypothetical protein WCW52_07770 [Elusimicrobiales bacterium]|jgi:hypothetical protein